MHFIKLKLFRIYDSSIFDGKYKNSFLFQNVNAIEVSVPVGNVDHTTYVVGLTTFLVSASTFYILVTLFRSHSSQDGHIHQD